ncbi:MAG: hypothetical protein AABY68_00935 [Pseudomonadota bacterium]
MSLKPALLEQRVQRLVAEYPGDVFLRADFEGLGGYAQVGRALHAMVKSEKLLRIGYGVYARAVTSPISGKPMPPKGLVTLIEAVERLGFKVLPTRMDQNYSSGKTTQVPTGRAVAIKGRLRRKLGYNGVYLSFERAK